MEMELIIAIGIIVLFQAFGMWISRNDVCNLCRGGRGVDFHTEEVHRW